MIVITTRADAFSAVHGAGPPADHSTGHAHASHLAAPVDGLL